MTTQAALIDSYLHDETRLLHDWYQQVQLHQHPDLEPIATFPTLEELQAMAKVWWQHLYSKNKQFFEDAFCKQPLLTGESACVWWQRIRKESKLYQDLIVAIVDELLLSPLLETRHLAVTVTLIVSSHFLDRICEGLNCDG